MVTISIPKNNNSRKIPTPAPIPPPNEAPSNPGFVVELGGPLVDLMVEVLLAGRIEKWGVKSSVVTCAVVTVVMGTDVLMFRVMTDAVDTAPEVIEGADPVLFPVVIVDPRVVMLSVVADDVVFSVK